ncbi:M14-type cytosolic carboxypeptidase [Porticoccus sp. W117]|uniref:M14 family metallopeptidase n=1 Tax=Porticoccus sp. W117 TaxID=3054777 RepID=UPI002595D57A|nr:M14-type cytosolic carboxypeptidase [Porticoccus sp. W117]MDM3872274.1 M14-type cytosolic carboxypeptidase [Porticoccus sp. W117]
MLPLFLSRVLLSLMEGYMLHPGRFLVFVIFLLPIAGFAQSNNERATSVNVACEFDGVSFDANFETGRLNGCRKLGKKNYELIIKPESLPAHNSPWYAFRVVSETKQRITVRLTYTEKSHRYHPKTSTDKRQWTPLPKKSVKELKDGKQIRMRLAVGPEPTYVAGQEILDNNFHTHVENVLAKKPYLTKTEIGKSEQGRPIYKLESNTSKSSDYLVIVGRQHPAEVTGALGMMFFVNTLLADTPVAKQFREKINLLIVFNLNPDGVALGHWRKNTNGIDLNRDWGPFKQAETSAIGKQLARFKNTDKERIRFFVDFHSTTRDIFYTLPDDLPGNPAEFINTWLDNIQGRMPDYKLRRRPGYNPKTYVSKNYIYKHHGAPAVTYEFGDNTSRQLIRAQATVGAEELMKMLIGS